jgi:hypothetical protein
LGFSVSSYKENKERSRNKNKEAGIKEIRKSGD